MKRQKIALVTIVKNESRCIARMLESARPWVDELIVVDTGSQDNTVEIAEKAGATVSHFEWCNDFSAARNHSLSMTKAAWRLVLDADEFLVENQFVLSELRKLQPEFVGLVKMENTLSVRTKRGWIKGASSTFAYLPRLLPRGIFYTGLVHEQPDRSQRGMKLEMTALRAIHDGYEIDQTLKKRGRNRGLIEMSLRANREDPYLSYQYAKELLIDNEPSLALDYLILALNSVAELDVIWEGQAVLSALEAARKSERFNEGFNLAEQYSEKFLHWSDFWFRYSSFLESLAFKEKELAPALFIQMRAALERCIELGDSSDLIGGATGVGDGLAKAKIKAIDGALSLRM